MKTFRKFLALACLSMTLFSCESTLKDEELFTDEVGKATLTRAGIMDSMLLEDVIPLEKTDELKALKERVEQLKLRRSDVSSRAYYDDSDYDGNFSSNIWNIREMPITIQARGQANTSNRYLQTNGKSKELSLAGSANSDAQRFYLKIPPSTSGIPYIIYVIGRK